MSHILFEAMHKALGPTPKEDEPQEPECAKCGDTVIDPEDGDNCPDCGFGKPK